MSFPDCPEKGERERRGGNLQHHFAGAVREGREALVLALLAGEGEELHELMNLSGTAFIYYGFQGRGSFLFFARQ